MNWKTISRNVGLALLTSSFFMLLSVIVSLIEGKDSAFVPLLISFIITFIVGAFPFIFVRKTARISLKEGYVIIFFSWLLSFVFGTLPYALWGGPFTIENAWFESVSGFTTTGATILKDIEALPRSLLFWRASTHFIGGLGVVVFLLLIIPTASPIRLRLSNMELSSISKSSYSSSANKTVFIFAYVYLALFVLAFVTYLICGMNVFDAVCHAMSVCATGGFSTRNLSIGSFGNWWIEFFTVIFMLLSSLHFGLLYISVATRSLKPLNNPVIKFFLGSIVVVSVLAGFSIKGGTDGTLGESLWTGIFHTVSTASTTGFAIGDNATWPMMPNLLLLVIGVMCGCAGSTTGGVKADRILVLMKSIGLQISKVLHPSSVNELKLGGKFIREEAVSPQILYIAMYFLILAFSMLLNLMFGANSHSSFAASISCLSNVGPAIQELGSMGNFDSVPVMSKFIFSLDMFLGRVEIYPVFAVVAMIFDRKSR